MTSWTKAHIGFFEPGGVLQTFCQSPCWDFTRVSWLAVGCTVANVDTIRIANTQSLDATGDDCLGLNRSVKVCRSPNSKPFFDPTVGAFTVPSNGHRPNSQFQRKDSLCQRRCAKCTQCFLLARMNSSQSAEPRQFAKFNRRTSLALHNPVEVKIKAHEVSAITGRAPMIA